MVMGTYRPLKLGTIRMVLKGRYNGNLFSGDPQATENIPFQSQENAPDAVDRDCGDMDMSRLFSMGLLKRCSSNGIAVRTADVSFGCVLPAILGDFNLR